MIQAVIFDMDGVLIAVSYTHLDVYKRQEGMSGYGSYGESRRFYSDLF